MQARSGGLLPGYRLSTEPGGQTSDGLALDIDRFAAVVSEGKVTDPYLQRGEVDGLRVWRVQAGSLEPVRELAAMQEKAAFEAWMSASIAAINLAGASLAAWIELAVIGAVSLAVSGRTVWTIT